MYIFLASDPLATWGYIASIILLIYLLVFILIGLVLALVLLLGMTWVREKIELIKPKVVITLGNFATRVILDRQVCISRVRGQRFDLEGRSVIPTSGGWFRSFSSFPNLNVAVTLSSTSPCARRRG